MINIIFLIDTAKVLMRYIEEYVFTFEKQESEDKEDADETVVTLKEERIGKVNASGGNEGHRSAREKMRIKKQSEMLLKHYRSKTFRILNSNNHEDGEDRGQGSELFRKSMGLLAISTLSVRTVLQI